MNRLKLFKASSIAFIILGLLHLVAHFGMTLNQEPNQLMMDMQNYKINMFGEHNLLQFHSGFSLLMGFLISAFGLQSFLCADFIVKNRKPLLASTAIAAVSFVIAFMYFHVLAYGFLLFSLACYTYTAFQGEKSFSKKKSAA